MYDPYVTREMTVRDLLVHRSGLGLGAGDLMFFPPTDLSREEIVRRLRFIKPATSFRSRYAYDNLLYLVAGQLIAAVTGQSWDDFVAARIFRPLGMTSTITNTRALRAAPDIAAPHSKGGGKLEVIPDEDVDNNAPAGSIGSSVSDLAKWVIVQLNRGAAPEGRLFSEAQSREMWSPQTIVPVRGLSRGAPPEMAALEPTFNAYGLGWMLRDYRGRKIVYHTGSLAGYVSRIAMVPELRLGTVVLTNQEATGAHSAIAWTILDSYLGAPPTDWVAVFAEAEKREQAAAEAAVRKSGGARNAGTHPSLPLSAYAGRYRDAWYGDILIQERGDKLSISFTHTPQLTGALEHWQYDTFVARWQHRALNADAYVTFALKPDGSIERVKMAAMSPLTDFSFDFQDLLLRPVPLDSPPR
jgi:CubicO group peptidase (beta-lactamase class C family)